jgi:hypothetical protein
LTKVGRKLTHLSPAATVRRTLLRSAIRVRPTHAETVGFEVGEPLPAPPSPTPALQKSGSELVAHRRHRSRVGTCGVGNRTNAPYSPRPTLKQCQPREGKTIAASFHDRVRAQTANLIEAAAPRRKLYRSAYAQLPDGHDVVRRVTMPGGGDPGGLSSATRFMVRFAPRVAPNLSSSPDRGDDLFVAGHAAGHTFARGGRWTTT